MEETAHNTDLVAAPTVLSLPRTDLKIAGSLQEALFVIGAPRSGTTLLYKMLCLHPDSVWISNYLWRLPQVGSVAAISRLANAVPAMRNKAWFGDGQAYRYGKQRSIAERAFPAPVEGEPFFGACGLVANGVSPTLSRLEQQRQLRRRVRTLCRAHGGTHFISKRIAHNQRIDLLAEAFPNAKFVNLIRDGRDVAASLRKVDWWPESYLPWFGGTPTDWEQMGRDPWQAAALHWVHELDDIEKGFSDVDPSRILSMRYEDLLVEPQAHLEKITSFAGLTCTDEMAEIAASLASSGASKKQSEADIDVVLDVQRERLLHHGYEVRP